MRCKNCGWVNPANNAKCEKCNVPLSSQVVEPDAPAVSGNFEPKETARGCPNCGYPVRMGEKLCPRCGHQLISDKQEAPVKEEEKPRELSSPAPEPKPAVQEPEGKTCASCKASVPESARFCHSCGASLSNENKITEGTVYPWAPAEQVQIQIPECSLVIITKDGVPTNDIPLRFSGNEIQLSRNNTEPGNQTITSKTQAELYFENDKWYIQDKSALKTTYIYAGEKKELKSGDVIVLGNRSFEFSYATENRSE